MQQVIAWGWLLHVSMRLVLPDYPARAFCLEADVVTLCAQLFVACAAYSVTERCRRNAAERFKGKMINARDHFKNEN